MDRKLALFAAPLVGALVWLASGAASHAASPAGAACDVWTHEPLVAYDVTGATLAGPVDLSLHAYNDGVVKLFSQSQARAEVVYLTPAEARALARDLALAGGFTLCDDPAAGSDVPLQTLTLFRGGADAPAHTVNWWTDDPPYDALRAILDAFIAAHVP